MKINSTNIKKRHFINKKIYIYVYIITLLCCGKFKSLINRSTRFIIKEKENDKNYTISNDRNNINNNYLDIKRKVYVILI